MVAVLWQVLYNSGNSSNSATNDNNPTATACSTNTNWYAGFLIHHEASTSWTHSLIPSSPWPLPCLAVPSGARASSAHACDEQDLRRALGAGPLPSLPRPATGGRAHERRTAHDRRADTAAAAPEDRRRSAVFNPDGCRPLPHVPHSTACIHYSIIYDYVLRRPASTAYIHGALIIIHLPLQHRPADGAGDLKALEVALCKPLVDALHAEPVATPRGPPIS